MKRLLQSAIYIIALLAVSNCYAQVPKIEYVIPPPFKIGTTIDPLVPKNTGGAVPATPFGQITTFAGNGTAALNNGIGTAASFNAPYDVKLAADGNLYVADAANNVIRKISPTGLVTTVAGTGVAGAADGLATLATFNGPSGIALDNLGNIFVADRKNHTIRKISAAGVVSTIAGKAGVSGLTNAQGDFARFNLPTKLTVDKFGGLYVTDYGNNVVRHVGQDGNTDVVAGSSIAGSTDGRGLGATYNAPIAITRGSNGLFYSTDYSHIRTIDEANNVVTIAGNYFSGDYDGTGLAVRFDKPAGVVRDAAGVIFVADYNRSTIRRIDQTLAVNTIGKMPLNGPAGVDIDANGNLYIADEGNNVIRKMVTTGYSIEPALSAGLVFDNTTGIISGTPTAKLQATNYTVTAYNTSGRDVYTVTIEVREAVLIPQVITFGPLPNKTVGDADFSPGATSPTTAPPANRPLTFTSSDIGVVSILNGNIHINGPGTATVTAYQVGSIDYSDAEPVSQTITVAPAPDLEKPTVTAKGPFIFPLDQFGNYTTTANDLADIQKGPRSPELTTTVRPSAAFTCEDIGEHILTVGAGYGPDPADPQNATFNGPSAITYDASGNIYISDQGNYRVRRYGTDTRVMLLAGGIPYHLDGKGPNVGFSRGLLGIATDAAGNTFVCDVFDNSIRKITPDGVATTFASDALRALNNGSPTLYGIAIDKAGNIFASDKTRIFKISPDGATASVFAGTGISRNIDGIGTTASFAGIIGLFFDKNGDLFLTTSDIQQGNSVRKITPAGLSSTVYSLSSAVNFKALVVNSKGDIYVGSSSPVIYKITQAGEFSIYAGGQEGFADGSLLKAKFHNPQGIAIDPQDNLYIADSDNHRIRMITPAGKVETIAGNGNNGAVDNTLLSNATKVQVKVTIVSELKFTSVQGNANIPAAAACPAFLPDYLKDAVAASTCANKIDIVQSPAAGTPLYIGQPITVTLTATDNLGQSNTQTFTVSAVPLPKPTITIAPKTATNCDGGPITFVAQTQGEGSKATYGWLVNGAPASSGGKEYTSSTLKTGDKVTCIVTNHDYCEPVSSDASPEYAVSTQPSIATSVTVSASTTDAVCPGVAITFTATPGGVQAASASPSYQWKVNGNPRGNNSATFTANNLVNGDAVICEMASNIKCAINATVQSQPITVRVKTDKECAISIPTAFTPNGDGNNDVWDIPELSSFPGCNFSIFNRYGKVIYHEIGYSKPWDGIYNGSKLPAGTYYFIIDLKTGSAPLSGPVTIIR